MPEPAVLHVIPSLRGGGAEHMLARLAIAERANGANPVIVNLGAGDELGGDVRASGVTTYDLGLTHAAAAPVVAWRLSQLIRKLRPVAIQSWMYYADLLALWALEWSGRRPQTRLYWGVRGSQLDLSHYRHALRWAVQACAKRADRPDAVVANSFVGRAAHLRLGYQPKSFPIIPNGVDTGRFRPDPALRAATRAQLGLTDAQFVAIHAARTDPMKDHDTLLAVAQALPDVQFIAVGAGTQYLAAPANVRTLGHRRDLPALFVASDLAVSTSAFGEGFPNVVAEAMSSEVQVVATDVGDAGHIVGAAGEVVAARNVPDMVAAINRLRSQSESERSRRAAFGRQRIEQHFSMENAVTAFRALHLHGTLPAEQTL